jgi:streptomycin 6-kinase
VTTILPSATVGPGIEVPKGLIRRWVGFHSEDRTRSWLDALPATLETWCTRHAITLLPTTPPISFNLVLFGESPTHGGVVLKLSPPSAEVRSEIGGLREAAGHGMVRLIDADPNVAIMVLERVQPGTMLDEMGLSDEEMTIIGAESMRSFWREPADPSDLWPLRTWMRELLDYQPGAVFIPADLISHSQALCRDMLDVPTSASLLHGDMHHQNILRRGDHDWVTIDPKGLIGERAYEVGTWMLNPGEVVARADYLDLANRRLDLFAEMLGEDRDRMACWTFVHSVISLAWTLSDDAPASIDKQVNDLRTIARLLPLSLRMPT